MTAITANFSLLENSFHTEDHTPCRVEGLCFKEIFELPAIEVTQKPTAHNYQQII